jgi:DNA-binding CsgD family transcriptional regulator
MQVEISLDTLSELIALVYDSALEQNQWRGLNARIVEMFPGHVATVLTRDGNRLLGIYTPVGFNSRVQSLYETMTEEGQLTDADSAVTPDHLSLISREGEPQVGDVTQTRTAMSEEEFRSTAAYRTFLKPAGLGHWTALRFAQNGTRIAILTYCENERDPTPKDTDGLRRVLELISPHIVRGARIARALYMAKEAAETYKGFLDGIALPLLIADAEGQLQVANRAGQRLLDRGAVFEARRNRLRLLNDEDDQGFRRALRGIAADSTPRGQRIAAEGGALSLCIAPFHPSMSTHLSSELDVYRRQPLYAVFVGTQGTHAVNTGLLRDVFNLTAREAEVCAALLAGQNPAQIADASGRALKTVRNQIQAVHEKVGVTSVAELSEALSVFRTVGAVFDGGARPALEATGRV